MRPANQLPDITKLKYKRILLLFSELDRHHLNHQKINEFLSYYFSLVDRTINEIIRIYTIDDFDDIEANQIELEYKLVDDYVRKIQKQAQIERKEQLKLYTNE